MPDEFESLYDRRRDDEPRVNNDLTHRCRERLAFQTYGNGLRNHHEAFQGLVARRGFSELTEELELDTDPTEIVDWFGEDFQEAHNHVLLTADTITVLSYLEYAYWKTWNGDSVENKEVVGNAEQVQQILESEGILWELKHDADGQFRFQEIGHKLMKEADEELTGLMMGTIWEEPLNDFNKAYELYLDRKYGCEIPEKLYNAIEDTVKTICVDLEDWEDNRDRNLVHYLDILREKDVFSPNPIMKDEIREMADSLEKTFAKVGNDRKNRHSPDMDRYYCSMLLHQVSAYLVFIINRYEQKHVDNTE